jgi:hypothetical protein
MFHKIEGFIVPMSNIDMNNFDDFSAVRDYSWPTI